MESPKASVGVRGDKIIIASSETTNKKVVKYTGLVSWATNVSVKADWDGDSKEWDVNLKTEVLWKNKQRFRLDKLMKEVCPTVGEIWKYTPFPPGTLPTVLVNKDTRRAMAS